MVLDDGSKIYTIVDAIGYDRQGNIVIAEFKSSKTARLTKNQKIVFKSLQNKTGTIRSKNKGKFSYGLSIDPQKTKIRIIRPKGK